MIHYTAAQNKPPRVPSGKNGAESDSDKTPKNEVPAAEPREQSVPGLPQRTAEQCPVPSPLPPPLQAPPISLH